MTLILPRNHASDQPGTIQLAVGDGYDVAVPDLAVYGDGCGRTGQVTR